MRYLLSIFIIEYLLHSSVKIKDKKHSGLPAVPIHVTLIEKQRMQSYISGVTKKKELKDKEKRSCRD